MRNKNSKPTEIEQTTADTSQPTQKKRKKNRTAKIIAVAVTQALGVGAIVGLSVALYYSQDKIESQENYKNELESVYSRAYYDLTDAADDIDITMAKLAVASTPEKQRELLYDLWKTATLAENHLGTFQGSDEGVLAASKFVNQLGDYSLYLAGKISKGEAVTPEEKELLTKLKPATATLKKALKSAGDGLNEGKLFVGDEGVLSNFAEPFSAFVEPDIEYPEMIYDGPFSDALENKGAEALQDLPVIDENKGAELLKTYFPNAQNVSFVGKCEGRIPTLNYSLTVDGNPSWAQLSQKGGKLINFNSTKEDGQTAATQLDAGAAAVEFAKRLGYGDMQVVWSATANGQRFFNLAPVQEGVIIYPDLVKVKTDAESGNILGFDSSHHAYNHKPRILPKPVILESDARKEVFLDGVGEGRLSLIPKNGSSEVLAYEFEGESEGTYFIYIDALTGEEADILYVVDTDNGTLLM